MSSSRLLTLLSLLQARRDWPGGELAERLEVSRRTIRRDVERLRELGYPVESLTGPAGGYRLAAGTAMPPLLLDDDEAIAIAVGLRTAARTSVTGIEETSVRALVKLEQVLPAHLRRRVSALGATTMSLPPEGPTVDPQCLTVLAGGCRDRECVRFGYQARDGEFGRREVEPHALVNRGRRWYLVCWDRGRDDWRTFRVDRITKPAGLGVRFKPRRLPAPDAATFVEQRFSALPSRYEARLTLHAPAGTVRMPVGWGTIEPLDEHTSEYRSGDDNLEWLAMRVAMLGVDFELHEPPELVEELEKLSARLATGARSRSRRSGAAGAASRRRGGRRA
ncbi:MAG: YafY family protein [Solirubrobacteraceae bacterium]